MKKKDYIPTESERLRDIEARREMWKTMPDIQHVYECKYNVNGTPLTEKVTALTAKDAEELVKQQCGMVGWIPTDLQITQLEDKQEA